MAPRPALERLKDRPRPTDWRPDELVSIAEAAALFFPAGPLTANALRLAYARGQLGGSEVCGRLFTTPAAVASMTAARLKPPCEPPKAPSEVRPCGQLPADLRRRLAAKRRERRS